RHRHQCSQQFGRGRRPAMSTRDLQAAKKLSLEEDGGFNPRSDGAESVSGIFSRPANFSLLPLSARIAALAALGAALVLTGCKPVGPDYKRPAYQAPAVYKDTGATAVVAPPPSPAGGGWSSANPSDGMLKGKWWQIYNDPELNRLEDRIATNNVQLQQAYETYQAARAQAAAVRANLYPVLSSSASVTRSRVSGNRPLAASGSRTTANDFY